MAKDRWQVRVVALGLMATAALTAGCGSDGGNTDVAEPPSDPGAPASGTLRVFAYGDTVSDELIGGFAEENPDVELKTASFDSVESGAAKLAGGFEADVVQPCADEYQPLIQQDLLRPIDPDGITDWDKLAFRDSEGVTTPEGLVNFVPIAAGPQGLIYNTEEIKDPPGSWADLFDPEYQGRVAIDGGTWLTPIAEAGMALGIEDPMNMTDEQVEEAKDYLLENRDQFRTFVRGGGEKVNLFKSGEVVLADGGRGDTALLQKAGQPVEWVAPEEGAMSWVCGLGISSDAKNIDAAYRLLNYYVSEEGQRRIGEAGLTVVNPGVMSEISKANQYTADPSSLEDVITEVQPDNWQTWDDAWREVEASG